MTCPTCSNSLQRAVAIYYACPQCDAHYVRLRASTELVRVSPSTFESDRQAFINALSDEVHGSPEDAALEQVRR